MEQLYETLRPKAFAVAYRMLGSVAEAEDVVQEGLLRLHRAQLEGDQPISSPEAYLVTVVTRLAIDELRSARVRREVYVGEWLPEPVVTEHVDDRDDPAARAQLAESLSIAFLVVLESLTPEQRAVFLLREVFDYPYGEIARILGKSQAAARQLATRARHQVGQRRPRFRASAAQHDELARRFFRALEHGELGPLEALLAEDASLHGDGGDKVPSLPRPIYGRERVARTLCNWSRAGGRLEGVSLQPRQINGQPGALTLDPEQRIIGATVLEVAGERIEAVHSIVNPDKLRHLGAVGDLGAVLRRGAEARYRHGPLAERLRRP